MDDPAVFADFLNRATTLPNARSRAAFIATVAETFSELAVTPLDDIKSFISENSQLNRDRQPNQLITFSQNHSSAIQAVAFQLRDRLRCDSIPTQAQLDAIMNIDVRRMKTEMNDAIAEALLRKDRVLPDAKVGTLKPESWNDFKDSVIESLSRVTGVVGIPLHYVIRDLAVNNYMAPFPTRMKRLVACTRLTGPQFAEDNGNVYGLIVQYVGTSQGKSIVERHKSSRNGRRAWLDLLKHYQNDTYHQTLADRANAKIKNAHYIGERKNFTMNDYYNLMSKAFNDLALSDPTGTQHALSEPQKITKFIDGLKDIDSIRFAQTARRDLRRLPLVDQTFETFFNDMSGELTSFQTLAGTAAGAQNGGRGSFRHIGSADFQHGRGNGGGGAPYRGRGRGRGGRGGSFRGGRGGSYRGGRGGRFGGRGAGSFQPYTGQTQPEAKCYPSHVWKAMSNNQKAVVNHLKQANGWIDTLTPPPGHVLNAAGYSVMANTLAPANFVPLPPPPPPPPAPPAPTPPVPGQISVVTGSAGAAFGSRSGVRRVGSGSNDSVTGTIGSVTINGQPSNQPLYDRNGTRIA